jgi:hypothetical protein
MREALKFKGKGSVLVGIWAFTFAIDLTFGVHAQVQHGESAITCSNPASGATWRILIDYDRATVDTNPARINDATISWHNARDNGNYALDRKTGNLTVTIASSTGGYFLHDRCKLDE